MKNYLLILLLVLGYSFSAQNKLLDSLWKSYRVASQPESQRIKTLDVISFNYAFVDPDTGRILARQTIVLAHSKALNKIELSAYNSLGVNLMYLDSNKEALVVFENAYKLAKSLGEKGKMAASQQNIGMVLDRLGEHYKGLEHKLQALKLREEAGDKKALANSYANLGISYADLSDYPRAIDYYLKCQRLAEDQNSKQLMANNANNIALVYSAMDNDSMAIKYFNKAIELKQQLGLKGTLANSLANAASVYYRQKQFARAWDMFMQAYELNKELDNQRGIATSLANLGSWYLDLPQAEYKRTGMTDHQRLEKASGYFMEAIKISRVTDDKRQLAVTLNFLGICYARLQQLALAEATLLESLKLSEEMQELDKQETSLQALAEVYEAQHKTAEAFAYYKRHVKLRDSIYKLDRKDEVNRRQIQYEYDKKATADSVRNAEAQKVKDAEIVAQQAALKQERTQRFALYGGLVFLLAFGVFAFNRFRVTQKQKHIIEEQKHLVEEKQKEILDSIHYAKNIQRSLMPTDRYIERNLARLRNHKDSAH